MVSNLVIFVKQFLFLFSLPDAFASVSHRAVSEAQDGSIHTYMTHCKREIVEM